MSGLTGLAAVLLAGGLTTVRRITVCGAEEEEEYTSAAREPAT